MAEQELVSRIRKEFLEARKSKDTVKANLLSTLIGEFDMAAKNDANRPAADADAQAAVKKFLKGCRESLEFNRKAGSDVSLLEKEAAILESYLPAQLSEADLKKVIAEIVATLPEKSPKVMGKVMAELNTRHSGAFDGKAASQLVKEALSN